MRSILIIISYLLATTQTANADDKEKTLFAAASQATPQWQQILAGIQSDDDHCITHYNQQVALRVPAKYNT